MTGERAARFAFTRDLHGHIVCGGDSASTEVRGRGMHAELSLARKTGENNLTADTQLALAA